MIGLAAGAVGGAGLLSFVASGTEAAVASLDPTDRRSFTDARGLRLQRLLDARGLDVTLILCEVTTSLSLTVAVVMALQQVVGALAAMVVAAVVVALVRATAQALGTAWRLQWSRRSRLPLAFVHALLWPVHVPLCSMFEIRAGPSSKADQERSEAEFLALVEQGQSHGAVHARDREMVEAVFEFGDLTVARRMTPRPEILAVPLDIPWPELIAKVQDARFARVPVYGARLDDVVGVLMVKDLLPYRESPPPGGLAALRSTFVAPRFVPQTKGANAMLREFLAHNAHLAFVVDDLGTLVGLITLDDLLGALVGDMLDPDDLPEEDSVSVDRAGWYRVKGYLDLDDFFEETGIRLASTGFHTLAGFVFHHFGRLPNAGESVTVEGHKFVVVAMEGRRIVEVQVEKVVTP